MRFLKLKRDYIIKKVFGSENSKGMLNGFLNTTPKLSALQKTSGYTSSNMLNIPSSFEIVKSIRLVLP